VGHYVCRNVTWLHLPCVGVFASTPPPPHWVVHVRTPFDLRWIDVERSQTMSMVVHVYMYYTWVMVGCEASTSLGGRGHLVGPLPSTRLFMHIIICRHNIQTQFQTYFEIINNSYFLRLMFVYTSSDIYFTPRSKFWNLYIKFSWNCYLFMASKK
jgi:hypothetical protein